ncbi:dihydroorotate dehydrogenase [Clostridioides difficile]|uniref:dihydroorotate dehydrogenase n=1 Tax=Clostridioides difficile TaxID=1496 RepID=UPI0028A4EEC4|nr:dihydroorotate dehydrogenase [Clostridioides difficile]KAK2314035.1 diguanylate cyclase [Clostridioides difficile]
MGNLSVKFGSVEFKNPVIMASGTFGFGKEYNEIYDIQKLGGISSKGLTLNKKPGNNGMRVHETPSGMMNSVGLENPGVQGFIDYELPFFSKLDLVRIANVGGGTLEDYLLGVQMLNDKPIDIIELNISCPNVKAGGMAFGIKNEVAREVVREVRNITKLPLVIKLSPNAEDIVGMAKVCEEEGADGVSLVNTFKAIKATDAIEFIMAGATCIQVGTANFMNPRIGIEIIDGINEFMDREGIKSLDEIRGII